MNSSSRDLTRAASVKQDFHVVNALGTTLMTTSSLDLARSWVRRHIDTFPSIRVEEVTLRVDRRVVYRPARPAYHKEQAA